MNKWRWRNFKYLLRRKYYQVTNRNEYVEQRIVYIMNNYVEYTTQSKIESIFR